MESGRSSLGKIFLTALFALAGIFQVLADKPLEVSSSVTALISSGKYAPYMIGSWSEGKNNMKSETYVDAFVRKDIDSTARWSYDFGFEALGGYFHDIEYKRYVEGSGLLGTSKWQPGAVRLQQLYVGAKYRSLRLEAGIKNHKSVLVDDALSSGDVVRGINIRPIPQVEAGFIDFQDIPFTRGALQISGSVSYGRTFDGGYQSKQFNRASGSYNPYTYYTFKYLHFRTKPDEPLSVVFGMQAGGMFDGTTRFYVDGKLSELKKRGLKFKNIAKMLVPIEGNGDDYYEGNSVGSWDFKARYRFSGGHCLSAYFEWLFEDGSGVGKQNGFDGLWGLEFKPCGWSWLKGAVIEYLDFTNQSGPFHHSVPTSPGTTITHDCGGGDDYYNNGYYGPYEYYGMSIGTPFIKSPFYNLNGRNYFIYNRTRGFHIGVTGDILPEELSYTLKGSYQKAWGGGAWIMKRPIRNGSVYGELRWNARRLSPGLVVKGALALDRGGLRGNNFGALLTVAYNLSPLNLKH